MSVKKIALMVAGIVVIGAVVLILTGGFLESVIEELWTDLWVYIQEMFNVNDF